MGERVGLVKIGTPERGKNDLKAHKKGNGRIVPTHTHTPIHASQATARPVEQRGKKHYKYE